MLYWVPLDYIIGFPLCAELDTRMPTFHCGTVQFLFNIVCNKYSQIINSLAIATSVKIITAMAS